MNADLRGIGVGILGYAFGSGESGRRKTIVYR
jgi:hypothetical protein